MIDNKTKHYELPLPNKNNNLQDDVERIQTSFEMIDEHIHTLEHQHFTEFQQTSLLKLSTTKTDLENTFAQKLTDVKNCINQRTPIGMYHVFGHTGVIPEHLKCDGQLIKKADYPELSALLQDQYQHADDAADYFRMPYRADQVINRYNLDLQQAYDFVPKSSKSLSPVDHDVAAHLPALAAVKDPKVFVHHGKIKPAMHAMPVVHTMLTKIKVYKTFYLDDSLMAVMIYEDDDTLYLINHQDETLNIVGSINHDTPITPRDLVIFNVQGQTQLAVSDADRGQVHVFAITAEDHSWKFSINVKAADQLAVRSHSDYVTLAVSHRYASEIRLFKLDLAGQSDLLVTHAVNHSIDTLHATRDAWLLTNQAQQTTSVYSHKLSLASIGSIGSIGLSMSQNSLDYPLSPVTFTIAGKTIYVCPNKSNLDVYQVQGSELIKLYTIFVATGYIASGLSYCCYQGQHYLVVADWWNDAIFMYSLFELNYKRVVALPKTNQIVSIKLAEVDSKLYLFVGGEPSNPCLKRYSFNTLTKTLALENNWTAPSIQKPYSLSCCPSDSGIYIGTREYNSKQIFVYFSHDGSLDLLYQVELPAGLTGQYLDMVQYQGKNYMAVTLSSATPQIALYELAPQGATLLGLIEADTIGLSSLSTATFYLDEAVNQLCLMVYEKPSQAATTTTVQMQQLNISLFEQTTMSKMVLGTYAEDNQEYVISYDAKSEKIHIAAAGDSTNEPILTIDDVAACRQLDVLQHQDELVLFHADQSNLQLVSYHIKDQQPITKKIQTTIRTDNLQYPVASFNHGENTFGLTPADGQIDVWQILESNAIPVYAIEDVALSSTDLVSVGCLDQQNYAVIFHTSAKAISLYQLLPQTAHLITRLPVPLEGYTFKSIACVQHQQQLVVAILEELNNINVVHLFDSDGQSLTYQDSIYTTSQQNFLDLAWVVIDKVAKLVVLTSDYDWEQRNRLEIIEFENNQWQLAPLRQALDIDMVSPTHIRSFMTHEQPSVMITGQDEHQATQCLIVDVMKQTLSSQYWYMRCR
jgi:hypothetical protein